MITGIGLYKYKEFCIKMKKYIHLFLCVIFITSCGGRKDEKEFRDSIHRADSIALIEAKQKAAEEALIAAAEQARLDSLRLDSIDQEEKMRLKPVYFREAWWDEKALKRIGFKKTKDTFTPYDEDDSFGLSETNYTRTFNGRRIDIKGSSESCHGVDIIFSNENDKDLFIEELKRAGAKKDQYGDYFIEKYYITFRVKGKKIEMFGCG